ncbi:myo-inosose-2 dehydratase [Sphingomonas sp. CGMCC 1.13654]|uniref:Myo-inosose-2 dehydratase n=1 Tax=Sphingomonas chungangi TaxID=2683589 RepID=A0A838L393_9SPHN|nr:myo-inosose-2 dehydratase [Sphingomonas chungangi]MBA2933537.1 myo-inosose-2 dehydratase [Sphingomonas chungangi]MVW54870.1 myo-inosose-2 dehydratase [Sphingomonas chungangi]
MTIRWGVSPIAWSNDDMPELGGATTLETLLTEVRDIGFDGVELGNKFPRDAATLGPIMARHDLALIGGWYGSQLLRCDADAEIEALQPHLALLRAMGSEVFIIAETSNAVHGDRASRLDRHPVLDAADWPGFGQRLNGVAAHVRDAGLRLAYHYHLGTVVETEAELRRLIDVTDDMVGLVVDTGHAVYGGIDPAALVREHPERVAHVHCKDVRRVVQRQIHASGRSFLDGVIEGMFTVPGDGDYDFAPFFGALAATAYNGWIVVEAEQDPGIADPRQYQQVGLDTVKRLARQAELTV